MVLGAVYPHLATDPNQVRETSLRSKSPLGPRFKHKTLLAKISPLALNRPWDDVLTEASGAWRVATVLPDITSSGMSLQSHTDGAPRRQWIYVGVMVGAIMQPAGEYQTRSSSLVNPATPRDAVHLANAWERVAPWLCAVKAQLVALVSPLTAFGSGQPSKV